MKTLKTLAAYASALVVAIGWTALLAVACKCDREIRQASTRGERMDHVDDAWSRFDRLHIQLFGDE